MLLSIIVPCFNSEKYIARCLNSLIKQNYNETEIIVIDDGSTDNSSRIINDLSKKDKRIKYCYQNNSGVSVARNTGLEKARGDYIAFLDSDDTILPEMYSVLIEKAKEVDADIVHCGYQRIQNNKIKRIGGSGDIKVFTGVDALICLLEGQFVSPSVCNKVFRRDVIEKVRFDDRFTINEDLLFNYFAFKKSNCSIFVDRCFYEYHNEETSACKDTKPIKKAEDGYKVSEIMYFDGKKSKIEQLTDYRFLKSTMNLYKVYAVFGKKEQMLKLKEIRKQLVENNDNVKLCGSLKYSYLIIKYCPIIYKPIYKVYNRIRKPRWDF